MLTSLRVLATAVLLTATIAASNHPVEAAPTLTPAGIAKTIPGMAENVYWRGRGWGWGGPAAGAFVAGALIGGAVAAAPYSYGPGYYPGPAYYGPPAYGPPPIDDESEAYCMQRYRSYDPNSGTFLGNDGRRHPCP